MPKRIVSGNTTRFRAVYTPPVGASLPSASFILKKPDLTTVTLPAIDDTNGVWHADYVINDEGEWTSRFVLSGALVQAAELTFYVPPSPFVP